VEDRPPWSVPYWLDEPWDARPDPAPDGPVDVAIVGGGVTGCAAALALAQAGLRVRVYEAREVASGASGRNGGFALRGGAMAYDRAREQLGRERAGRLWQLTERALGRIAAFGGDTFRLTGSLRLAVDRAEAESLRAEHDALREDGFAAEWIAQLPLPLRGRFAAGLRHPTDGAIHPARWVRHLAACAVAAGAEIREGRRVESLGELEATSVVVATDGYTGGLVPLLDAAIRPTRGQVVATEPLPELLFPCPHYARHGFDYWQQTPDRRLVIGGWRDASLDAEWTQEEATTPPIQEQIEAFVRDVVGSTPRVTHRWAGIFGTTADLLPLCGAVPGSHGLWVAAGYSGHGNVLGFACGGLVAAAILGLLAPELELFDPGRLVATSPG
jgi:glycine/D-amino acid oxidase-like deaminating enzyme